MRLALALLIVGFAGTAVASPVVSTKLADADIARLRGCWRVRGATETWTFRPHGAHGLDVIRELGRDAVEAVRARIPRSVMVSATDHTFAFTAAGRIHGLMMVVALAGETLEVSVFSNHDGRRYAFTGNNLVAERC